MSCHRLSSILFAGAVMTLADAGASAQVPAPLSDKVMDLAGEWRHDPSRGAGGICGVPADDTIAFDLTAQPQSLSVRSRRVDGRVPLDGSAVSLGHGGNLSSSPVRSTVVAATDAGWLKLTMTHARNGGYTNVMQDVYILNRDRSELTLWRTLNVVRPDGSSGKIDCGNHVATIYKRQSSAK